MATVFHDVHGNNVRLSADNRQATRINKKDNSNGVVFSSRPLLNGETFEVQLDGESEHVLRSGLEIGITDLDPLTLSSSMPRTATDLDSGRTVMVSGQRIAINGRQVDTIQHNIYNLQVGEKVGLRLDGDSVAVLMVGELVIRVNVSRWRQVYAVVELYGKAETIFVTSNEMASSHEESGERMSLPASSSSSTADQESLVKVRSKLYGNESARHEDHSTPEAKTGEFEDDSSTEKAENCEDRSALMVEQEPTIGKGKSDTRAKPQGTAENCPGVAPSHKEISSDGDASWISSSPAPTTPTCDTPSQKWQLERLNTEMDAMIENMQQNNREVLQPNFSNVLEYYGNLCWPNFFVHIKWRKEAATHLIGLQAGHVIKSFYDKLTEWGLEDTLHLSLFKALLEICTGFTDDSLEFCVHLGEEGLLEVWTDELRTHQMTCRNSKLSEYTVDKALGLIHNCAKANANCTLLRDYGFIQTAQPYTDANDHSENTVLHAVLAISYVMEVNEASIMRISQGTMSAILQRLRKAFEDERHVSVWHAYELCDGLANLAADRQNLMLAVKLGAPGLFAMLLILALDDKERHSALNALDAHLCPASCQALAGSENVLPVLENTKQEAGNPEIREKAAQVHQKFNRFIAMT